MYTMHVSCEIQGKKKIQIQNISLHVGMTKIIDSEFTKKKKSFKLLLLILPVLFSEAFKICFKGWLEYNDINYGIHTIILVSY